eukprot:3237726-Pleurochrysis_carterae.AAC.1
MRKRRWRRIAAGGWSPARAPWEPRQICTEAAGREVSARSQYKQLARAAGERRVCSTFNKAARLVLRETSKARGSSETTSVDRGQSAAAARPRRAAVCSGLVSSSWCGGDGRLVRTNRGLAGGRRPRSPEGGGGHAPPSGGDGEAG